jgi:undecaprenyl-diphosphatase
VLQTLDVEILVRLNALVGVDDLLDRIVVALASNPLFRGFPVIFPLAALWFSGDSRERRSRMLVGLLATAVAAALSIWLQYRFDMHIRPFFDPALHLKSAYPGIGSYFDRRASFPSDTATLFFSLSAVIFRERRIAGAVALLWSLLCAGILRIVLGYHYPSDILGALVLGPGCVYLFATSGILRRLVERALARFESRSYLVHAGVVIFFADAYTLFQGLQGVVLGMRLIGARILGR